MVDVDGVIVRPDGQRPDKRRWDADLKRDLGLEPADLQAAFFTPHWPDIVHGRADLYDRLRPALATLAPTVSAEALVDYWFRWDSALDHALLADLAALRARGTAMHLATVQEHHRARYLWETLALKERFDAIHYSAAYGVGKPEPAFFEAVAAKTGYAPETLVLIDDSERNVEGARRAGWHANLWTAETTLAACLAGAR
jgi:putative hydrolase of the HAD superfamily